ncbi:MAG: prepilin-type N-terminal cleavage/methylation domain-containing protein [Phycisphaerales bacterium]
MHGHAHNRTRTAGPRGFTLIELLVVIVIIAVLVSVLLVGVRAAFKASQRVADQQAARALNNAIQQFKSDNGFLPPLAYDGNPNSSAPPEAIRAGNQSGAYQLPPNYPVMQVKSTGTKFVAVYNQSSDLDFFRGGKDSKGNDVLRFNFQPNNGHVTDPRYSKFSLPIYLSGVLDRDVDGRAGAGITQPFQDGTFAGVTGEGSPRPVDAIVEPTSEILDVTQTYADDVEATEYSGNASSTAQKGRQYATAFTDRYGRAFRYYRWEPGRNTVDAASVSEVGLNGGRRI